jgi:outer membrane protein TolC
MGLTVRTVLIAALACSPVVAGAQEGNPLTLDQAVAAALEASQETTRARLDVAAARAGVAESRAGFGPSVTASGGLAWIANPPDGVTLPTGALGTAPDPTSTFPQPVPDQPFVLLPDPENLGISLSVRLEQTLYSWGKLQSARAAAEAELVATGARLQMTRREVRRTVSESYIGLAIARESLPLVEEIVTLLRDRLSDRERQFEEGAVTRSAVLTDRALLAGGQTQLVRIEQGIAAAVAALAWLTATEQPLVALPQAPVELPAEAVLVARAGGDHPRLSELQAQQEQAQIQVDVLEASGAFLPDIGLTVEVETQGQRVPLLQANWSDTWDSNLQISIGARMLLFDNGRNEAAIEGARAQAAQAGSGVAEFRDTLPLQVRRALADYEIARARVAETEARLEDAAEQERNARVSFENGLIPRRDLLGAALQTKEAELSRLAALQSLWTAFLTLEELAGPLR